MTTDSESNSNCERDLNSLKVTKRLGDEDLNIEHPAIVKGLHISMLGLSANRQLKRRRVDRLEEDIDFDSGDEGGCTPHRANSDSSGQIESNAGGCFLGAPGVPAISEFSLDGANSSNGGSNGGHTKRRNFTPEEDLLLESGFAKWGSNWEEIRMWGNFQRSAESLSKRYSRIIKTQRTPTPESHDEMPTVPTEASSPARNQNMLGSGDSITVHGINLESPPPFKLSSILSATSGLQSGISSAESADEQPLKAPPQTPSSKKIHDYFPRTSNNDRKSCFVHSQGEPYSPGATAPSKGSLFEDHIRSASIKRNCYAQNVPSSAPSSPHRECHDSFLEKERLQQLQERLRELEKEREEARIVAESQREELRVLQRKNDALAERFEMLTKATEKYRIGARANIIELLAQQAREHGSARREQLSKDSLRLGTLRVNHLSCSETWHDGSLVYELKHKLRKIQDERDEIEKKRKILQRRKAATLKAQSAGIQTSSASGTKSCSPVHFGTVCGSELDKTDYRPLTPSKKRPHLLAPNLSSITGNSVSNSQERIELISPQEAFEFDETYRCRLATLRKEETELNQELVFLQTQQQQHMRQLRLSREEDASRFCHVANGETVILKDRYMLHALLGKGGFSEVWKAFDLDNMVWVACKVHSLSDSWSDTRRQAFVKHVHREYKIHQMVDHARVVKCLDVFELDRRSFITILEYCDSGDLEMYLQSCKTIVEREAKCILLQILSGLRYLNTGLPSPVIHFDLKPGNILFHQGEAKITDFGLSKIVAYENDLALASNNSGNNPTSPVLAPKDIQLTSQGAGTYWYLPPECFDNSDGAPMISSKVDVWSLGVIYYEMLFGQKPFGNDKSQQSILNESTIMNDAHVLVFPSKPLISQESKDFIKKCLEYRKALRPDVATLCEHPFLNPPANCSRKSST